MGRVVGGGVLQLMDDPALAHQHAKGCHCKKSGCLKKYCECFQAGIVCGPNCKCLDCRNCDGDDALEEVRRLASNKKARRIVPGLPVPIGTGAGSGTGTGASNGLSTAALQVSAPSGVSARLFTPPSGPASALSPNTSGRSMRSNRNRDHPPAASPSVATKGSPPRGAVVADGLPIVETPSAGTGAVGGSASKAAKKSGKPRGGDTGADTSAGPSGSAGQPSHGAPPVALSAIVTNDHDLYLRHGAVSMGSNMPVVLPQRRVTDTKALGWLVKAPRHRTFGLKNPRLPDHTVTSVFSYMTNDELYNSSLVCTSWAALAMDGEVWNWEGVESCNVPLTPAFDLAFKASPGRRFAIEASLTSPFGSPLMPTLGSSMTTAMLSLESPLRLHESLQARLHKRATALLADGELDKPVGQQQCPAA